MEINAGGDVTCHVVMRKDANRAVVARLLGPRFEYGERYRKNSVYLLCGREQHQCLSDSAAQSAGVSRSGVEDTERRPRHCASVAEGGDVLKSPHD